jgi:hypothetical protein
MHNIAHLFSIFTRILALTTLLVFGLQAQAQTEPLPSWNDGAAKQAILDFVKDTTTESSPNFVPPAERIATFDQDGTLWVEHPMYSQVMYVLESVPALVKAKPELATVAPLLNSAGDTQGRQSRSCKADHARPGKAGHGDIDRHVG